MLQRLTRSISRRHLIRTFTSTSPSYADAPAAQEYTFKHAKSKEMFDKMSQLQVEDIHILSQLINEKLGITITESDKRGFVGGGDGAGAAAADEPKVEKTAFDLKLVAFDAKTKIKIIKEVRAITGLGLKEAKEMVEGAPKTLKKEIKMEEAMELKAKLEAVGATIEIE
jgi:large subunit ribosomal protein L7/L12